MATVVTKLIGSGGDYTTLQAWFDAAPASLVTADQVWQGKIKAATDSFVSTSGTVPLVMSGHTVDATRYFELTTNTGASFLDDASIQTNPLRFGGNAGASISTTTVGATCVTVAQDYTRISKIQMSAYNSYALNADAATSFNCDFNQLLLEGGSASFPAFGIYGAGNKLRNSLVVGRVASMPAIANIRNGSAAYNCTFVVPSDLTAATVGLQGAYGAATVTNCAIFGASALSGGSAPTLTTCASDLTAGTGHIQVSYGTSTFVNVADATRDFRLVTGSGLIGAGTTDATNAATDIAGTARPQGTGYDIGAWEFVAGGGGSALPVLVTYYRRMRD